MKLSDNYFYEKTTKDLLKQVVEMGLSKSERIKASTFILMLRDGFIMPGVRKKIFPKLSDSFEYLSQGGCELMTKAFVLYMGKDWQIKKISSSAWKFGPHIFAVYLPKRKILDLSKDQYDYKKIEIPYNLGQQVDIIENDIKLIEQFMSLINVNSK